jgi:aconitate hydratase
MQMEVQKIIIANHTYNEQQIAWFKAGAALNIIRKQVAEN